MDCNNQQTTELFPCCLTCVDMILESPGSRYTSSVYSYISLLHCQIARQRIRTMVFLRRFIEAQREVEIAFQAEKYRDITGRWPVPRDSPAWGWTNSPTRMLGFLIRAGSSVVYCSGVLVTSQQMTSPPCHRPARRHIAGPTSATLVQQ